MVILPWQLKLGDERVVLVCGGDKLADFPMGVRRGRWLSPGEPNGEVRGLDCVCAYVGAGSNRD